MKRSFSACCISLLQSHTRVLILTYTHTHKSIPPLTHSLTLPSHHFLSLYFGLIFTLCTTPCTEAVYILSYNATLLDHMQTSLPIRYKFANFFPCHSSFKTRRACNYDRAAAFCFDCCCFCLMVPPTHAHLYHWILPCRTNSLLSPCLDRQALLILKGGIELVTSA